MAPDVKVRDLHIVHRHDAWVAQQGLENVPVIVGIPHLVYHRMVAQHPGVPLEQPVIVAAKLVGIEPEMRQVISIVVEVDRVPPDQFVQQPR